MAKLRKAYFAAISADQARELESVADDIVAHQACVSVAGFLYARADAKKRERK